MKKMVLRYGLYATLVTVGIPLVLFIIMDESGRANYKLGEIIGYSTILLSMVFVFLGIKKHRDENKGGVISFGEALLAGSLIAALPAIAFGLYNFFYIEVLDPEFMENYYRYYLEQAQASMSADEFEAEKVKIEAQKAAFQSPVVQFGVMFLTVFVIGFIVSLISAIVLKREGNAKENILDARI